jgi:hypothetical protein
MDMQVESKFLKAGVNVKDGDLVEFVNEGTETMSDYKDKNGAPKLKINITVKLANGKEVEASLNIPSRKNLVEAYGRDSKNWVGKSARVNVLKQLVGKEMKQVVVFTHPSKDADGNVIIE